MSAPVLNLFRLDGKLAVVTGCRRGIGRAFALALAEAGADIAGVSRSLEPDSEVERAVTALGSKFRSYRCDFAQREQVRALTARLLSDFDAIDILINNAGTIQRKPAAEHPEEYWDEVIETNLTAQFLLSRELGRRMVERGSGKIVFTASLLSFRAELPSPDMRPARAQLRSSPRRWQTSGPERAYR